VGSKPLAALGSAQTSPLANRLGRRAVATTARTVLRSDGSERRRPREVAAPRVSGLKAERRAARQEARSSTLALATPSIGRAAAPCFAARRGVLLALELELELTARWAPRSVLLSALAQTAERALG
jgi:hypothetical protein